MENPSVSLSETDYLDILSLIEKFNGCESRKDLKEVISKNLLPLFQASTCLYGWSNHDITSVDVMELVNMPNELDGAFFKDFISYDPLSSLLAEKSRPVMAHDVDISREFLHRGVERFLIDKPEYKQSAKWFFDKYKTALVAIDRPNSNLGLALHRLTPNHQKFEIKDIRKMELIRPHLINTIKSVILSEDLSRYKSLIKETLGSSTTAIALVKTDNRIIYQNEAFKGIHSISNGYKLSEELAVLVNHEISKFNSPANLEHSKIDLPFWKDEGITYGLSLSVLKSKAMEEECSLLIKLKPVLEPYTKMNILMQEAALTGREIEICTLVKDGIDDQEITSRLFISLHTVKNHLKSIHKKLSVNTRPQLVALLNQPR
jgi:DNA-binding CsgD family transcriptional regulator